MPERWDVTVRSDHALPEDFVVEHRLEGYQPDQQSARLHVAEIDSAGAVVDPFVPCQLELIAGQASAVFLLPGATSVAGARFFHIQLADNEGPSDELIKLRQGVMHQEQESYQITTPSATYFYHMLGAGFASMIDRDGKDWLSYRPFGGSDGKYRGIPNLAHPENHFHPGGDGCRSRVLNAGPLKITIASESLDGKWACRWEVYPSHARLTVLRVDHPYWFLYEGTPFGALDEESDYCVISDGTRRPLSERWERALPHPEWIYFGRSGLDRALFLAHHESDQHTDSYWPMEGNMTVFGFGRDGLTKFMTEIPAQFTIGFAESSDFHTVQDLIGALTRPESIAMTEN